MSRDILAGVDWKLIDPSIQAGDSGDGIPYATHEGEFHVGDKVLKCFQLSNGQRVIDETSMNEFFGFREDDNDDQI